MRDIDLMNPVWKNIILKKMIVNLNFFPGKLLLSKWQSQITDESSNDLKRAAQEIAELYLKSQDFPNAQKDIKLLLNK